MSAPRERLSDEAINRLATVLITLPPSHLAQLAEVRKAALRGSATAMSAAARERFDRGMVALEAIIEAVGGAR